MTARPVQTTSREFLTAVLSLEPRAAATSTSTVSHISGKASTAVHCVHLIFCSSHSGKTSDANIGSKHNAGIATASSARFEIHFIYPASGVMLCLLVIFAFSFGAACCFRFIPVFWVHVFACIRFVFFPLGPWAGFTSVFGFACIWLVYFFPWDLGRLSFHLAGSCVSFNSQLSHFYM